MLAIAEMFIQTASNRKDATLTYQLLGSAVTSRQVSHATACFVEVRETSRNSLLNEIRVLYLDARYKKIGVDGQDRMGSHFDRWRSWENWGTADFGRP